MARMLTLHGRRYENGEPVRITVEGERIAAVDPAWPSRDANDWPFVAPGLFDLQINGHGGTWFGKEGITPDEILGVLEKHFHFGVTRLCPTVITNSFEVLREALAALRQACEEESWAAGMVPGFHLEGPYISAEDGPRGAHPREHVRHPDWSEFQRLQAAAGGRICLITLAPELPGAVDFIRRASESGVTVSLGHTAASGREIAGAVEAGARLSTHLGNGAHPMLRRHPNYIWEQLGDSIFPRQCCARSSAPKESATSFSRATRPGSPAVLPASIPRGGWRWRCCRMVESWWPASASCSPGQQPTPAAV
jgi:N-acetylglucosamine-6-phosphate deacetylase